MNDAAATTATQPAPDRPGGAENVTLWVVQALLALLFAFAGASKLVNVAPEVVDAFATIGLGQWFRYLTGTLEVAGAIGLLIPRLSHLAALGLAIMVKCAVNSTPATSCSREMSVTSSSRRLQV